MVAFTIPIEVADPNFPQGVKTIEETHIFHVGGFDHDTKKLQVSGACYSIENNTWREDVPALNKDRKECYACQQGNYVYIFAGVSSSGDTNTIEKLNAKSFLDGQQPSWILI